jgi:hypothetical protein
LSKLTKTTRSLNGMMTVVCDSANRRSRRSSLRTKMVSYEIQPVSLPVIAGVSLDCRFWPEDDGWSRVCDRLMVIVRGSSFEDAKKHMEAALQEHIEVILCEQLGRSAQRVC